MTGPQRRPWVSVHVQETEDTPESDTISESRKSHFRKDRLRITSEYDTWERAIPDSFSPLFQVFSQAILQRLIPKVENMLFNTYNQHSPFLSPNYTYREALHGEQTVLCAHCLRRDSGQSIPAQKPTQELSHTFPQITLPSWWGLMYTAAGATSTDPTIPFRSHSRPLSSPSQSRVPPPQPRSLPSGLGGLRLLMLSEGSTLESTGTP